MPERDHYPREYFEGNPYEGETPEATYKRLRWGNDPQETFTISAPEPLATLGDVAQICARQGSMKFSEAQAPFLALGTYTNFLYFVPKQNGRPVNVPRGPYHYVDVIIRLDYYSDKGGEPCYYYHEHEAPFPLLYSSPRGVCLLVPATCSDGSRSYAVGDEGVIG